MTVADNLTKKPLLPVIQLTKNDDTTYTFNPFTSTFDFRVIRAQFSPPIDNKGGTFTLTFTGATGANSETNTIISNVDEGNEITVWIGKDDTNKSKLFNGIIETYEIKERTKNFMRVTITGVDFGSSILKHRVVTNQWVQKRDSAGILDSSDTTTTIQQIVNDLLTQTISYPTGDITAEDQGIVVDNANIVGSDIPLSMFNANYEFLDDKLQELDDIGGTIHYVDPDKNFIMDYPTSSSTSLPATILLTDDNNDSTATAWVATKVGLISPNSTYTRTLENHVRRVYGLGGENIEVDQSEETDSGNTTLETNHYAMRFTPQFQTLNKIHLKLSKIGTPNADFVMELREEFNSLPIGEVLRTITKDKAFLNGSGTTAVWSPFEINEELNTAKNYWIVVRKVGADSSNTFRWHHDNTDNNPSISASSSDDVTWTATSTPNRFNYAYRTWRGTDVFSVLEQGNVITSTDKHLYEDVIRKADITETELMNKLLINQAETMFKRKEILKCQVYAPDTLLTTGQRVRIRKQQTGHTVDDEFTLGKVDYIFESSADQAVGSFYYGIEAVRFVTIS